MSSVRLGSIYAMCHVNVKDYASPNFLAQDSAEYLPYVAGDQSSRIMQMLQGLTQRFGGLESQMLQGLTRFDGLESKMQVLDARVLGSRRSTADWAQEINSCICDSQRIDEILAECNIDA